MPRRTLAFAALVILSIFALVAPVFAQEAAVAADAATAQADILSQLLEALGAPAVIVTWATWAIRGFFGRIGAAGDKFVELADAHVLAVNRLAGAIEQNPMIPTTPAVPPGSGPFPSPAIVPVP